jgi:hypothetical protein
VSRCVYIIPPNLYPKTHVLKKIDTPTKNNQVQHCCKSDGGKGKSDLNRSCETFSLEGERSPQEVRSFSSSVGLVLLRRFLRTIAQEGAIDRRSRMSLPMKLTEN